MLKTTSQSELVQDVERLQREWGESLRNLPAIGLKLSIAGKEQYGPGRITEVYPFRSVQSDSPDVAK